MAETDRSFRKFMTDPKNAVMHYIAENLPPASQSQGQGVRPSSGPDFNHVQFVPNQQQQQQTTADLAPVNHLGHPSIHAEPSQPPSVYQQYNSNQLNPQQGNGPSTEWMPRPSSTPGATFTQQSPPVQAELNTYHQLRMNQHARTDTQNPSLVGTSLPMQPNAPVCSNMYDVSEPSNQAALQAQKPPPGFEMRDAFGMVPPSTPIRQANKPPAVSRAYHRMILEYEKTKTLFFAASAEHNVQIVSQSAYQLECLALQIWSLRREHAFEFEGYSTAEHAAVILDWHTKYSLWADIVLDIQEGLTLSDRLTYSGDVQTQSLNTYISRLQVHSPSPARNEQQFTQQTNPNGMMGLQGQQDANGAVITAPPSAMNTPSMYQSQVASQSQPVLTPPNVTSSTTSQYQQTSQNQPAISRYQESPQNLPNVSQPYVVQKVQQHPAPQNYASGVPSQQTSQSMYGQGSLAPSPNANGRPPRPQSNNSQPGSAPIGIGTRPSPNFTSPSQGQNVAVKPGPIMN